MIEQFARLNAKTASFTSNGLGALLEVDDLCGVLASLEEHHAWYVYAMIEQRRAYNMDLLHRYCMQLLLQEMYRRKFKSELVKPSEFAYGITKAVIHAHFHPKGKCRHCNGLGKKGTEKCAKCEGAGTREHTWADKVCYGFPLREDLSRKWYRQSCQYYDRFVESTLAEIQEDLKDKLAKVIEQSRIFRREDQAALFD